MSYELFNKKFFREVADQLNFFNMTMVHPIDKNRKAEIVLVDRGHHEHYVGYNVSIIHKENGVIVSEFFGFNDYLGKRTDDRRDEQGKFEVIGYVAKDWYIAKPSSNEVKKMAEKIMQYIELYK